MRQLTWPNWVDLLLVILTLRACYVGYGRGLLAELLQLVGLIAVTILASNLYALIAQGVSPWWGGDPAWLSFICFSLLFLSGILLARRAVRKITNVVRWERLHWTVQTMGIILGALRGIWWSGLALLFFLAFGVPYLTQSIQERSLLGSRLAPLAREQITRVADCFPGHLSREALIPQVVLQLPSLPQLE